MKKLRWYLILFCCLFMNSCNMTNKDPYEINTSVVEIDQFGSLILDVSGKTLKEKGYDYGDIIFVDIENHGSYSLPYTTAYTDVGIGNYSICNYSDFGKIHIGKCFGNFVKDSEIKVGQNVYMTLCVKGGYKNEYDLTNSVYYKDREKYNSDEEFANFREVSLKGFKKKLFYRSSSPINANGNPNRYLYANKLAEENNIEYLVDLADSEEKAKSFYKDYDIFYKETYCPSLIANNKVCYLNIDSDIFSEESYKKLSESFKFVLDHDGPFLVHCTEGKDRTGFYFILLESLAGCSMQEIEEDFMQTYINFYKIEKDSEQYKFISDLTFKRLLYLIQNPDCINDSNINWDAIYLNTIDLKTDALVFLLSKCYLTSQDVLSLIEKIKG